jgi:hypothetical protein
MAFYEYETFEAWLALADLDARFPNSPYRELLEAMAREAFEAARAQPVQVTLTIQPNVMSEEEWTATRKEDGECSCKNCWNRYIEYYGSRRQNAG